MKQILSNQRGNLVRIYPNNTEKVLAYNETWANLAIKKRQLIQQGCPKEQLKLRYMRIN